MLVKSKLKEQAAGLYKTATRPLVQRKCTQPRNKRFIQGNKSPLFLRHRESWTDTDSKGDRVGPNHIAPCKKAGFYQNNKRPSDPFKQHEAVGISWEKTGYLFILFFQDKVSPSSPTCLGTPCVEQAGLELRDPPLLPEYRD